MSKHALWIFVVALWVQAAVAQAPGFSERAPRYKLQSSDTIQVQYRYTPEFNQTVTVQPDGYISLQAAGQVKVSDMTAESAAAVIAKASSARLRDPEVNVVLVDYVKPYVVVAGEVTKPGRVELRGQVSVVEAIALAGGFKESAKTRMSCSSEIVGRSGGSQSGGHEKTDERQYAPGRLPGPERRHAGRPPEPVGEN